MTVTIELDAIGLLCPLPVLKARKRLAQLASGDRLRLLADDRAALIDIPHFCAEAGHQLLSQETSGRTLVFVIEKGGVAA
ncbi:MAG: sulfurtransferase TusA family protein [Pseudomonadota bacterium]